eukprot:1404754-Amphidinium_carterae.1
MHPRTPSPSHSSPRAGSHTWYVPAVLDINDFPTHELTLPSTLAQLVAQATQVIVGSAHCDIR